MLTVAQDRYLRTILFISEQSGEETVSCGAVANTLNVTPSSATNMLQSLAAAQLIEYAPHQGVRLLAAGMKAARTGLRRQRLVESFLCQTLGLNLAEVETIAEKIAEAFPDELVERINCYLGEPIFDPHGDVIYQEGKPVEQSLIRLSGCSEGTTFRVGRILGREPSVLRYLEANKIALGATGEVLHNCAEADLIVVSCAQSIQTALSMSIAAQVLVTITEPSRGV